MATTPQVRRGLWILVAVITCPCHLLILAVLLSGTAAGALLADHLGIALVIFLVLFVISLTAVFRDRGDVPDEWCRDRASKS